jgi:aspartate racemase
VAAGAELVVRCTNTMHKVADAISAAIDVPFVHIADTTADAVREAGASTVGLLATAYTMEHDFYVGRLRDVHGLKVLVPSPGDRRIVHDVIYDELCLSVVSNHSRREYRRTMRDLAERGAQAILLGCTEIDLLVGPDDAPVPVFDTTRLHAEKAVEMALEPLRARRAEPLAHWRETRAGESDLGHPVPLQALAEPHRKGDVEMTPSARTVPQSDIWGELQNRRSRIES